MSTTLEEMVARLPLVERAKIEKRAAELTAECVDGMEMIVSWDVGDEDWTATCGAFPNLIFRGPDPLSAAAGLRALILDVLDALDEPGAATVGACTAPGRSTIGGK